MKKMALGLAMLIINTVVYGQITGSSFATTDYTSSGRTQGIATADFDGDGKQDVVVGNTSSNTVSIFRNTSTPGNISFATKIDSATGTGPTTVLTGDMDGDGKLDIVIAHWTSYFVSIYRNTSTGVGVISFAAKYNVTTEETAASISIADFDGDGKLDMQTTNYFPKTISFFRNTSTAGNLNFATRQNFTFPGDYPTGTVAADFDGDNKLDIAIAQYTSSGSVRVYRNTSTIGNIGINTTPTTLTAQNLPNGIASGDVDGDGKIDIVVANYRSATVSVYRNTTTAVGSISFATQVTFTTTGTLGPCSLLIKDMDGDGKPELCVTNGNTSNLSVFRNIGSVGNITTNSFATKVEFNIGSTPNYMASADIDGDSRPDLLTDNTGSNAFSILRNQVLSTEPSTQASNLSFSGATGTALTLSFTKGNGTRRMVVIKAGSAVSANPSDSTTYDADSVFGSGSQLGSGNYVVYNDTGSTVTLTGLSMGQVYHVAVYEANGSGAYENVLTASPLIGNYLNVIAAYYNKSSGNLNDLSAWGTNTDGSGTAPANFTTAGVMYKVQNNSSPTLGGNLTIGGSGSFLSLGDGSNSFNLVIPAGNTLAVDSIGISTNITLTIQGTLASNKIYFQNSSTAQFTSSSAQNIPKGSYSNLIAVSSQKTLIGDVNVRGSLVMTSNIICGSYTLSLGESATAPGSLNRSGTGIIQGRFARWFAASTNTGNTGLFPIGSGSSYLPTLINYTSAPSAGGLITMEFITGNSGNNGLPLYDFSAEFVAIDKAAQNGFWRMTTTGVSGGTYTATLTAANFLGVNDYTSLRMLRRTNSSSAWTISGTAQVTTGSNSSAVLVREGLSSGSCELGIGGDISINPLPVKWQSFTATFNKAANNVELNWVTASEINNDYFEVQRSTDNSIWQFIGRIASRGNTNTVSTYKTFDNSLPALVAQLYYRIKQVDKDGAFSYSSNTAVVVPNNRTIIKVYPLPLQSELTIQLGQGENLLGVKIFDTTGKLVAQSNETTLSVAELQSGMYLVEVQTNVGAVYTKVVK